jgi:hypothetical protein
MMSSVVSVRGAADQARSGDIRALLARHSASLAALLLLVHVAIAWLARQPGILLGHNDAMYAVLGESLRRFSYRELWYVGTPPHAMYPPAYPALLAILESIHGNGFHWLVWSNLLASCGALALLFAAIRTSWGAIPALGCLLALVVNPAIVMFAGTLGAETQMMLAIAVVVYALVHEDRGAYMSVLAGGGALAAALLRSAAVPLVVAVALYWILQRRYKRAAIYVVASVLLVGSWLLWSTMVPNQSPGRSYVADAMLISSRSRRIGELIARVGGHAARYASIIYWELPMPTLAGSYVDNVFGGSLVFSALAIGLVAVARMWPATALFLVFYGGLLAVWPYIEDRFLVPVLPLIVVAVVMGCVRLMQLKARWAAIAGGALLLVIVSGGAYSVGSAAAAGMACGGGEFFPNSACVSRDERSFFDAMKYIRDNTPADAVFLSAKPATVYYYTSRRSVIRELAARQRPEAFLPFLESAHARYLLLGRTDFAELYRFAPRIQAVCESLDLEWGQQGGVYLFRVRDEAGPGDGRACQAMEEYLRDLKSRHPET